MVADDLYACNGVVLSEDEESVVMAEFARARLVRHYVAGPRRGATEEFARMPGLPDNVKSNGRGGFLVGVPLKLLLGEIDPIWDGLLRYPRLCRFVARLSLGLKRVLSFLREAVLPSSDLLAWAAYRVAFPAEEALDSSGVHTFVIELDKDGKVLPL